ncbi:MAG TPA: chemotaxis protein CheA [Rectinemataceae bacterium]|nr:chemotaxis protein CheA [Rectinemataceae bacterium]
MSDYLDPNNEELLKDFFAEAQSQVETLEQSILVLENDTGNRDAVDEIFRAAHTLKGGAGTVEMTELADFTHIVEDVLDGIRSGKAKVNEEVIDALLAAIDVIKAMLDARAQGGAYDGDVDTIKTRLARFLPEGSKAHAKLAKAAASPSAPAPAAKPAAAPASASSSVSGKAAAALEGLTEYELLELREAAGEDRRIWRLILSFNPDNLMNTVSAIHAFAALRDVGTILKTVPDFEKLYEDAFYPKVEYFIASDKEEEALRRKAMIPEVVDSIDLLEIPLIKPEATPAAAPPSAPKQAQPASASQAPARPAAQTAPAPQTAQATKPAAEVQAYPGSDVALVPEHAEEEGEVHGAHPDARKAAVQQGSILRVDSRRIDNLLNLVSETVINKATFNQISTRFGELQTLLQNSQTRFREGIKDLFDELPDMLDSIQSGKSAKEIKKEVTEKYGVLYSTFDGFEGNLKNDVAKFRSTAQNLGRITGELQEAVMKIRMVPISQIFSRFPRLVRDLSKTLSKKVNLVIEGEDTELDKSVIEDLLDPLMHAVRNALDHGVETPDARLAAGKPEEGRILLRASNEGNMIIIEIADDGKGIDIDAIRQKAVERGLVHPSKILTEVEAFNLIFDAGFSTAKSVTNISGRGVGLDVVKRQIEKLNGSVTVSSQPGKGTRFTIKLPLTLAIIQGLLVRVGREIYSIPITSVIESHRIKTAEIRMIDNYEVFNIRNDVVALLRLNRLFRIDTDEQRENAFIVIVGTADKRVGLMVDSLIGEEDVVIKPLRDQFTVSPGIAGASILGDGSVCLIIDVSQLLELGQKRELEERRRLEGSIR